MDINVILNKQHKLLPDQERVLADIFGKDSWTIVSIPEAGLTANQQEELVRTLTGVVVFASCPPVMVKVAVEAATSTIDGEDWIYEVLVFGNDVREKKELPNGRVISVMAQTGWYLR